MTLVIGDSCRSGCARPSSPARTSSPARGALGIGPARNSSLANGSGLARCGRPWAGGSPSASAVAQHHGSALPVASITMQPCNHTAQLTWPVVALRVRLSPDRGAGAARGALCNRLVLPDRSPCVAWWWCWQFVKPCQVAALPFGLPCFRLARGFGLNSICQNAKRRYCSCLLLCFVLPCSFEIMVSLFPIQIRVGSFDGY